MKAKIPFGTLLFSLFACQPPQYQIAPQEIIGGQEATAVQFPAVVALVVDVNANNQQFFAFCTGTLVDPEFVLTAAHCVQGSQPDDMKVLFGTSDNRGGSEANQIQKVVEVERVFFSPKFNINNLGAGNDIGVLKLAEPVTDIEPIPYNKEILTDDLIGKDFIAVGFGTTDPGSNPPSSATGGGLKRFIGLTLNDLVPQLTFYGSFDANVCFGDSGGPDIMEFADGPRVIGVHSFVTGPSCHSNSASQRTDAQAEEFIDPIVESAILPEPPHCLDDGVCENSCGAADPDCQCRRDGFCDEGCPDRRDVVDPDCASNNLEEGGCAVQPATHSESTKAPLWISMVGLFSYLVAVLRRTYRNKK